jgi:predicted alternative tryptophan synthase beta-subunit
MVKVSLPQKPYGAALIQLFGAQVSAAPAIAPRPARP